MKNYTIDLPRDKGQAPMTNSLPPVIANQSWSSVFTISSTVGLSDSTTSIQITAIGAPVQIKWGAGSITGTSFDASIPKDTEKLFVVPVSVIGTTSVAGANGMNGLYNKISLVTVGGNVGSILAAEY